MCSGFSGSAGWIGLEALAPQLFFSLLISMFLARQGKNSIYIELSLTDWSWLGRGSGLAKDRPSLLCYSEMKVLSVI